MSEPNSPILPEWASSLAVFDLETTGVDTRSARIVTACLAVIDSDGGIVESNEWLADPGVEIPWQAQRVHGISTKRAQEEGLPAAEAVQAITNVIDRYIAAKTPIVAYNAPFDFTILRNEQARYGVSSHLDEALIVDPLVIDKAVDTYRKGKRTLEVSSALYDVVLEDAHNATADAVSAGRVAQAIAKKYADQLNMSASDLHAAQVEWSKEQAERFTKYMRERRDPKFYTSGTWPMRRS